MRLTRLHEAFNHRPEEGTRTARRLDRGHDRQIAINGVSGEVEDQLDDPAAREHLAVVLAFMGKLQGKAHLIASGATDAALTLLNPIDAG